MVVLKKGLFFAIIFFAVITYAQERVNLQPISFNTEVGELETATGWCYNATTGKWINYDNILSTSEKDNEKQTKMHFSNMAKNTDNFITIKKNTVTVGNQLYYILTVKKWTGSYEYPSIRQGWSSYKDIQIFIFTLDEYSKLNEIKDYTILKTQKKIDLVELNKKNSDEQILDKINAEIQKPEKKYMTYYQLLVKKTDEGKIRFLLPASESRTSLDDFKSKYFETEYINFAKIVKN